MNNNPLDAFQDLLNLLLDITDDERIAASVRYEIAQKILEVGKKHGIRMEG